FTNWISEFLSDTASAFRGSTRKSGHPSRRYSWSKNTRGLFEFIEAPTRWIDLGAFAGFFSIWLLWNRRRLVMDDAPCEALLIDADEVRTPYIRDLFRISNLTEKF